MAKAKMTVKRPVRATKRCPRCGKRLCLTAAGWSHVYSLAVAFSEAGMPCDYTEKVR